MSSFCTTERSHKEDRRDGDPIMTEPYPQYSDLNAGGISLKGSLIDFPPWGTAKQTDV